MAEAIVILSLLLVTAIIVIIFSGFEKTYTIGTITSLNTEQRDEPYRTLYFVHVVRIREKVSASFKVEVERELYITLKTGDKFSINK